MTALRLTLRLNRFEILAFIMLAAAFTAVAGWQAAELSAFDLLEECLSDRPPQGPLCERVGEFVSRSELGNWLLVAAQAAPFLLGVLLGAPIVAHEIETGSAQLTWSLDRRTGRWFVQRFVAHLGVVIALTAALGLTGHVLEAALYPQWDPLASFHDFGSRGLPLVARAVATYSLAALLGALVGRVLPAIIMGGIMAAALWVGLTVGGSRWITPEAVPEFVVDSSYRISGIAYGRDGSVFTPEQVAADSPHKYQSDAYWRWLDENFEILSIALPPARYGEAVAGEAAVLLAGSTLAGILGTMVVRRRRPHV